MSKRPRNIIDLHQHAPSPDKLDERAEACRSAGIEKAVLLGLPASRFVKSNEEVLAAADSYPDLFIPFYGVEMEQDGPDDISRAHDLGFRGLKCIAPIRPYNDKTYFSLYERAAALRLPIVFHLGIVGNTDGWRDCDSNLMRPIHLDHIARRLPELLIIGAHFGNPWSDEAAMACRWNPNLFFDFSGSLLKYRKPEFIGDLLWWRPEGPYASPDGSHAWSKIVFGSDVASEAIEDVARDYENAMSSLALEPELRDRVWRGTAGTILDNMTRMQANPCREDRGGKSQ